MNRSLAIVSNIVGHGPLGQALRTFIRPDDRVVFFCVKAFDLSEALIQHADLWPRDIPFVTLSNGYLGDVFVSTLPKLGGRVVRWGMTTLGATLDVSGELKIYDDGSTTCWGLTPQLAPSSVTEAESQIFSRLPEWKWQDDMRPTLRRKWILNATLNTMCGALRLATNASLLNHRATAEEVFKEAYQLSRELWPDVTLPETEIQLRDQLWSLVERTGQNENSMMRDVRLGRRTESQFLAGQTAGRRGYDKLKTYHAVLSKLG